MGEVSKRQAVLRQFVNLPTKLATGKAMQLLRDPADRTVKLVANIKVEEHLGLGKQARPWGWEVDNGD